MLFLTLQHQNLPRSAVLLHRMVAACHPSSATGNRLRLVAYRELLRICVALGNITAADRLVSLADQWVEGMDGGARSLLQQHTRPYMEFLIGKAEALLAAGKVGSDSAVLVKKR